MAELLAACKISEEVHLCPTVPLFVEHSTEDFNSRNEMWSGGGDGYLRPDQFLDHLTVIIMQRINDLNLTKQLVRQCVVKQTSVGSSPEQSGELRPAQSTSFLQNWQILLTHNEDSKVRR